MKIGKEIIVVCFLTTGIPGNTPFLGLFKNFFLTDHRTLDVSIDNFKLYYHQFHSWNLGLCCKYLRHDLEFILEKAGVDRTRSCMETAYLNPYLYLPSKSIIYCMS